MNGKERLTAVFQGKKPDHLPWAPLLDDYYTRSLPVEKRKLSIIDILREVEADILLRHVSAPYLKLDVGGVGFSHSPQDNMTRTIWQTPWGNLQELDKPDSTAETVYKYEFPVKELKDYDIVARVWENGIMAGDFSQTEKIVEKVGDDGLITVSAPGAPLVQFFRYREPQQLLLDLMDYPDFLQDINLRIHEKMKKQYEILCQGPADILISYSADLTTRLLSPSLVREFALQQYRDYAEICHRHGKQLIIHACGDVRDLLPIFGEAGLDGIDSLSFPPLGNTTMAELRRTLGTSFLVIGGVSPVVLAMGSEDDVAAHVQNFLSNMETREGLVLCVSDATPFGTPLKNLQVVSRLVRDWRV